MANRALDQFHFLFSQDGGYLRIPIWGHIPLSYAARRVIEHPSFVRLSKIRQLGFVYYVFPGASHTRFEHSVGTYYLGVQILQRLVLNPINWYDEYHPKISPEEARLFLASALLHDIGHYPFAHLVDRLLQVDESQTSRHAFKSHEERVADIVLSDKSPGSLYVILKENWDIGEPEKVVDIVANPGNSGLPGKMLSGILDPDKMDYLMRDAHACGVPYGTIDVDRLIESLVLDVSGTRHRLAITEKGVASLESLVFAKYMMFRHIYWHHAVRIAVAMFTRFVQDCLAAGVLDPSVFYDSSDDSLIEYLASKADCVPSGQLIINLKNRMLYKRGITLYPEYGTGDEELTISGKELERVRELYWRPDRRREKEIAVCKAISRLEGVNLSGFEVLLDIPRLTSVFDIEDFQELHVLVKSQIEGESRFVPFNSYGFSQLTANFAQEFERFSRRVQVICRSDIQDAVRRHWREIREIVVS
jgi:HD superfamily phosphohydrolase